jgi:hypothetical protein
MRYGEFGCLRFRLLLTNMLFYRGNYDSSAAIDGSNAAPHGSWPCGSRVRGSSTYKLCDVCRLSRNGECRRIIFGKRGRNELEGRNKEEETSRLDIARLYLNRDGIFASSSSHTLIDTSI